MNITFIGDVHGKVNELVKVVKSCYNSTPRSQVLCVGDLGFNSKIKEIDEQLWLYSGHFFSVVGNHDDVPNKDKWPYLGNFKWFPDQSIFTVRGADSIDKHLRTEGIDWFTNEELNYQEQLEAFDFYCKVKPRIVVSHDCPQLVMEQLFGYPEKSQTRTMLQFMFIEHQPEMWIFGHHHKSRNEIIDGTRFICLAELETLTIEI